MTIPAAAVRPRPALTALVLQMVDEEGRPGIVGRQHLFETTHPYHFVSRRAAAGIGCLLCDRCGFDGFRLRTPGQEPPPALAPGFSDGDTPF